MNAPPVPPPEHYRFGPFELDVTGFELRREGRAVRIERRPLELLVMMARRPRQLITRADIVEQLWGKDVFVDVDTAVNTLVWKVRQALHDSTESPTFVETVSGKGYRFIGAVDAVPAALDVLPAAVGTPPARASEPGRDTAPGNKPNRHLPVVGLVLVLAVLSAGWWWHARTLATPQHVTVAVLPFVNLTGEAEREYIADGLSEEMVASLGQIDAAHLSVIGRTSMMLYKNTRKSLAQIGRELGAAYLVESSIRAEGSRLRITSTLVRAADQVQVWSASFDREPTSLLGLQREISGVVARQIRLQLSPDRARVLARRDTADQQAYDLYLQGRYFANQRSPQANGRAIELLTAATERDPQYALAWAALADTYAAAPVNGDADPRDSAARALAVTREAARANPDLAETQAALASVNFWFQWDWKAAETAARRAVALDPNSSRAHVMLAVVLSHTGRFDDARREIAAAVTADPLDPLNHAIASEVAFRARNPREALSHARRAVSLGPRFWIGYMTRAQAEEQAGNAEAALESLTMAATLSNNNSKTLSLRGYVLAKSGHAAAASDLMASLEAVSRSRYLPPYAMALVAAGQAHTDRVFEWLERAYAVRDIHLVFLTVDPKWDPYRRDPRFVSLLSRCGFIVVP